MDRSRSPSTHYAVLDVMRGFAALWVFASHNGSSSWVKSHMPAWAEFARSGWLGVIVFFVISGYCLLASARSAIRNDESSLRFIGRRMLRILPPFWISVAVCVAVPYAIEAVSMLRTGTYVWPEVRFAPWTGGDWVGLLTLTRVFGADNWLLESQFTAVNAVYWTLAIEVQFYLVVALALAVRKWFAPILVAVTVVGVVAMADRSACPTGLFLPYWPYFAMGMALYVLVERGMTPERLSGLWRVGVSVGTGAVAAIGFALLRRQHVELSESFGVCSAVALWAAHPIDSALRRGRQSSRRLIVWPVRLLFFLGTISYTVYLLHGKLRWLVIQGLRQVMDPQALGFLTVMMILTVLACIPFYLWFEKPFARHASALGRKRRSRERPMEISTPMRQAA